MSLDLWLAKPSCPTCGHEERTESLNFTYNVYGMWREIAFSRYRDPMVPIDGLTGLKSIWFLHKAINQLEKNPDKFIAMNHPSGWGSYEDFLKFLKNLLDLASKHPEWTWQSCR